MLERKIYAPYFEAVKKIVVDREPIENLDQIRTQCNREFLQSMSVKERKEPQGYTPETIVISFATDAENRILMGEDPAQAYSIFDKPEEFRERSRKILINAIRDYLD